MTVQEFQGIGGPLLIALAVGLAATFAATGWLVARIGRGKDHDAIRQLQDELSRTEVQTREQSRQASRMRSEQRNLANFLRILPGAVQQLNSDRLDSRAIPRLILQMTAAIFEPRQILLYLVRTPHDADDSPGQLHLVAQRGLTDPRAETSTIAFGEGKIGWVARHQVEMASDDWLNPGRTEGAPPSDNHEGVPLDLIGPLLHHGDRGRVETFGVLCVGGAAVRPRDEKLMLQMVTNLGAIALTHARNLHDLKSQAHHDGLTGLMNKQRFMESLGLMINEAEREVSPVGVFMFDIDHFKTYNDTNGHMAGDELLKRIARVIRDSLRPGDLPCRYGGEEFLVAMPDTDASAAHGVAERIRAAVEETDFPHGGSQPLGCLTISGGVAAFPVDGTNSTELVRHADQALYRAKAAGRNRVMRFEGVQIGGEPDEDEDFDDYDGDLESATPQSPDGDVLQASDRDGADRFGRASGSSWER